MSKDFNRLAELYDKYLSKNISDHELREFFSYVQSPNYANLLEQLISNTYENPAVLNSLSVEARQKIFDSIILDQKEVTKPSKQFKLWAKIVAVAAILTVILSVSLIYIKSGDTKHQKLSQNFDIAPGSTKATLTLSDGRKITLSDTKDGELAKEAGVTIRKSANGEVVYEISDDVDGANKMNTLSTSNGETYKLRLPDGTFVWLNAASSLTYSSKLIENGKRTVSLTGEAYFEVAKDRAHPFIVTTRTQNVEVLGTHFNINSYPEEANINTTLLEGSVAVSMGKHKQVIKAGEQVANNGASLQVNEVNVDNVVDWKNGDFNLDEIDFRVSMRKIARWYNVDIIYDASVPENIKSGGWISRDRNLSAVLKHIQSSGQVHFKINGRKLYVSK